MGMGMLLWVRVSKSYCLYYNRYCEYHIREGIRRGIFLAPVHGVCIHKEFGSEFIHPFNPNVNLKKCKIRNLESFNSPYTLTNLVILGCSFISK